MGVGDEITLPKGQKVKVLKTGNKDEIVLPDGELYSMLMLFF